MSLHESAVLTQVKWDSTLTSFLKSGIEIEMSTIKAEFREAVPDHDTEGFTKHAIALIIPMLSVGFLKIAVDFLTTNAVTNWGIAYNNFGQFWMIRSVVLYALAYSVFAYLLGKNLEIDQRKVAWVVWLGLISISLGLYDSALTLPHTLDTTTATVIFTATIVFSIISHRYLLAIQDKKEIVRSERRHGQQTNQEQNFLVQSDHEIDDEAFYKAALDEYEQDEMVPETWAKALSLSSGVNEKAKWKYVELRVAYLTDVERREFTLKSMEVKQTFDQLPQRANANKNRTNLSQIKSDKTYPKQVPPPTEAYALIFITLGAVAVFFVLFTLSKIS